MKLSPRAGKVISGKEIPQFGVTQLTLSNGVNIILKPTNFKNDQILYGGYRPGGTSLYDGPDFDVASNSAALIGRSGLADFTPIELNKALNGKLLNSSVNIAPRSEVLTANTSVQDLETALQVTYLQFTSPKADSVIFKNTIDNAIAGLANRNADPNLVFADTVNYVLGNYNYRSAAPSADRLGKISLQRAYEIYKERFSDASGFTFVFVGSFKTEVIVPMLEKYLGSLPTSGKKSKARDLGIHIPEGRLVKKVYHGTENKALVKLVFSGNYAYSPQANLQLKALSEILQIKILQQMREASAEVYSPQVQPSYNKYPQNRFAVIVQFGCAPKNVEHLISLLETEMKQLREQGPDEDDIQKFKAQYSKNVELALTDNSFWYSYLLGQCENNEDILQVRDFSKNLDGINANSLKASAAVFLSGKNMIAFELLPQQAFE